MRRIDWISKLRHVMMVWAFCLVIVAVQVAMNPEKAYAAPTTFSLLIGTFSWAFIDIGREFIASAAETGWPPGAQGVALVVAGTVLGYLAGNWVGDRVCIYLGFYPPGGHPAENHLRSSVIVSAIAGTVISYYFYSINKSAYLERKMGEARQHANEARLKLLETQLEPHMLFNTLANLRALIAVDPPRAQVMLDHMIAYLRATLSASRSTSHPLEAEFERLRDYLELMAIRMGPRLAFALDLPEALRQVQVPALLLQPLVENSIQHGLEPKVGGGRIDVAARRDGAVVELEVRDTGVGAADAPRGGKGFGLAQIRERLATVYAGEASFDFDARPGEGARTVIRIPLAP